MSRLKIIGNPTASVNIAFKTIFGEIAQGLRPITFIERIHPYYNFTEAILKEEDATIQRMAKFMLEQGLTAGVKWDDKFYYGKDIFSLHLQSNYLDDIGTIVLVAEGETVNTCLLCEQEIQDDKSWQSFRDHKAAHDICLTKFALFKATGKEVMDVGMYTGEKDDDVIGTGRVYLNDGIPDEEKNKLGCALTMQITDNWDNAMVRAKGRYYLQIENMEYLSNDLEELEVELYQWARSAGWCDNLGLKATWDKWNSGGGCMIWDHDFMDGKSIHVTDECFVLSSIPSTEYWKEEDEYCGSSPSKLLEYSMPYPTDKDAIAFLLVPYIGQEMADMITADIYLIVEGWVSSTTGAAHPTRRKEIQMYSSEFVQELAPKVTQEMTPGFTFIKAITILSLLAHVAQEGTIWMAYDQANKFMTDKIIELQPELKGEDETESDCLFEIEDLVMALYAMRLCNAMSLYWANKTRSLSMESFEGFERGIDFRTLTDDLYN